MRAWPVALLAFGAAGLFFQPPKQDEEWTVLVTGDLDGYLSPCGCTKPMSGGIRRMATVVRQLTVPKRTALLVDGGFVIGEGRQDEIKAETLAECFKSMGVAAVNLAPADAALGVGSVLSVQRLTGDKLVSTSLDDPQSVSIPPFAHVGPFVVGGAATQAEAMGRSLNERTRSVDAAAKLLDDEAKDVNEIPVLLLQGSLADAEAVANRHPHTALIVYRASGDPPRKPIQSGTTVLVTPGEFAKHVLRLKWRSGRIVDYEVVSLTEDYKDDLGVSALYKTYLTRIDREGLLDQMPRMRTPAYAGSAKCASCHPSANKAWIRTAHAKALKDLEVKGHDRDPDCVPCHVTGLGSTVGFRSRKRTPLLAYVGCESCHGPAADHAWDPGTHKLPKLGPKSCNRCHDLGHSPGFVFPNHWAKIAHG